MQCCTNRFLFNLLYSIQFNIFNIDSFYTIIVGFMEVFFLSMWYFTLAVQGVPELASVINADVFHINANIKLKKSAYSAIKFTRDGASIVTRFPSLRKK